MKTIVLIAPPASGKGTQAKLLCEKYKLVHISTGDLLREASTKDDELGSFLKSELQTGKLISDEIINKLLCNRLNQEDIKNGFVLDGYPRNINQASSLIDITDKLNISIKNVIYIDVPKEVIIERMQIRLMCSKCGSIYNTLSVKPKNENICDLCNSTLKKRDDDNITVFQIRYDEYMKETYPLIKYFESKGLLSKVNKTGIQDTFEEIEKIINRGIYDSKE